MRVLIIAKRGYTGRDGVEHPCGTVAEFDEHLAVKLMNNLIAVPAPEKPKRETAVKAAPAANTAKATGKAPKPKGKT
jgi:hypothetical protein